ncbi:hypothetical protein P1X14_11145 [Sphingomonas sp. AOB5]|nr:hypothetical protein [Sphingomonas sp. AOB5]
MGDILAERPASDRGARKETLPNGTVLTTLVEMAVFEPQVDPSRSPLGFEHDEVVEAWKGPARAAEMDRRDLNVAARFAKYPMPGHHRD